MTTSVPQTRVLVGLLALLSLIGYMLRSNITVAQELMVPDLGLSMADMGLITGLGFQLAYAIFQVPAGVLGDRFGAKPILGFSMLGMGIASLASGLVGAAGGALILLFAARSLLGVAQAAVYPVGAMAIRQRVPSQHQTTATAIFISAALLGSALAPLTLAPLTAAAGWRPVFLVSGLIGLLGAAAWFAFAPAIPRPAAVTRLGTQMRNALALFRDRDVVLLSLAYLLHSAVFFVFIFWFFRYLIDARGMSLLGSGVWGSIPPLTAFLLAPVGGMLARPSLSPRASPTLRRRRLPPRRRAAGAPRRQPERSRRRNRGALPFRRRHQRGRRTLLGHHHRAGRERTRRRSRSPQPDGQPRRSRVHLGRSPHARRPRLDCPARGLGRRGRRGRPALAPGARRPHQPA